MRHLAGVTLFMAIAVFAAVVDNVEKIHFVYSRLPVRFVVEAKQDVKLNECKDFRRRTQIGVLKAGEIADLEMITCANDGYWTVKLSDGSLACYSFQDQDKTESEVRNFYYF